MTKDEKIKEEQEVVKSRSTRHALERVLKSVQLHMPPDGISERDAMGRIIEAVDPMPDDFDSEKCIKEVMELVYDAIESAKLYEYHSCQSQDDEAIKADAELGKETEAIESKLRELIQ